MITYYNLYNFVSSNLGVENEFSFVALINEYMRKCDYTEPIEFCTQLDAWSEFFGEKSVNFAQIKESMDEFQRHKLVKSGFEVYRGK